MVDLDFCGSWSTAAALQKPLQNTTTTDRGSGDPALPLLINHTICWLLHPSMRGFCLTRSATCLRRQGLRGMGQALEKLAGSYSSWRRHVWSAREGPAPQPIADPEVLATSLRRAVADTANQVRAYVAGSCAVIQMLYQLGAPNELPA